MGAHPGPASQVPPPYVRAQHELGRLVCSSQRVERKDSPSLYSCLVGSRGSREFSAVCRTHRLSHRSRERYLPD